MGDVQVIIDGEALDVSYDNTVEVSAEDKAPNNFSSPRACYRSGRYHGMGIEDHVLIYDGYNWSVVSYQTVSSNTPTFVKVDVSDLSKGDLVFCIDNDEVDDIEDYMDEGNYYGIVTDVNDDSAEIEYPEDDSANYLENTTIYNDDNVVYRAV